MKVPPSSPSSVNNLPSVHRLIVGQDEEVLSFLAVRPVHTFFMTGLIQDNGLESESNRGTFYACRDPRGQLQGVALIGHAILIETSWNAATEAFARVARGCPTPQLIRGEFGEVERFWRCFTADADVAHLRNRESLLILKRTPPAAASHGTVPVLLRVATLDDLPQVMSVNAAMACEERGVNPLERDPIGFRQRSANRIRHGRVWVCGDHDRLTFKADLIVDTAQAAYLEGVYVHPEWRGEGFGSRCMSQLGRMLLERTRSICLTVNEANLGARAFYHNLGYEFHSNYETIYLKHTNHCVAA